MTHSKINGLPLWFTPILLHLQASAEEMPQRQMSLVPAWDAKSISLQSPDEFFFQSSFLTPQKIHNPVLQEYTGFNYTNCKTINIYASLMR